MSALLDSANWAKAAGPSVTPKRGPSAAEQKEFEDALAKLDRVVNAITQMKEAILKMRASLPGKRHTDPGGFAREFTQYVNGPKSMRHQAKSTLAEVGSIRKQLAAKGVDTNRFDPLVRQVEDLNDFADWLLELDPLVKILPP